MPKFHDRTCANCGAIEHNTATQSLICRLCFEETLKARRRLEEHAILTRLGYSDITEVGTDSHGKRRWSFIHTCGTKQTWIFPNIRKQLNIRPDHVPCSKCGGNERMSNARSYFMAKYGITKEQMVRYERYSKKVRHLSDKNFKLHQQELNPLGLLRGRHTWHLDHKDPIIEGFLRGASPEEMARKENLQLMPAKDNLSKGRKILTQA